MNKVDRLGLLIGTLFVLILTSPSKPVYAQELWPPFRFRMTPSYQEGKITYSISFSKRVEAVLTDVAIKIPLPEGTRFLEAKAEAATSVNFDGVEVTFFTSVLHRPIRQAYFVVEVTDPTITIFTTHAWISWTGNLPGDYLTDDQSIDITLQPLNWEAPSRSRLQLQASAAVTDTDIIYTIYPKNVSNRRIWDLNITTPIPEGVQFLAAEAPPPFVANFDGQNVSFSILELEKQVELTPLRFRVSIKEAAAPFLVNHAWATWKNAGRGVGQRIEAQENVRTGDIVVQPYAPQLVVSDITEDTPFGNYDLTSVALQEIAQGGETALKVTFYTAEPLSQIEDEPLDFILWIDSDCRFDTGQPKRNIAADYQVTYNYEKGQGKILFWNEQEERWQKIDNLNGLAGGKMVTMSVPYHLINNSANFCWVAQAKNKTKLFNPDPPSDWMPHWTNMGPRRYEAMGVSAINQLDAPPPFYGIEQTNGDEVNILEIRANHGDDDAGEIIAPARSKH